MNYQPLCLSAGEDGYPRSSKESTFALPPPVVLFRLSLSWMMPTDIGEGDILHSVNQFKYQYLREALFHTDPEIMFAGDLGIS